MTLLRAHDPGPDRAILLSPAPPRPVVAASREKKNARDPRDDVMGRTVTTVITFGTYDLFHYGHLRILKRAMALGDRLVVGVSSDALNYKKKGQTPAVCEAQRVALVAAIGGVSEVFIEESLEAKADYCRTYGADIMVMGDDHEGRFDDMLRGVCECVYLPRTADISSTALKTAISANELLKVAADCAASAEAAYSASQKNLVHATTHAGVFAWLVEAHDAYYDFVMASCTPFCAAMPREVTVLGRKVTVFTANGVTYGRAGLAVPIALAMKRGSLAAASALVLFHDFLDHFDGVVAKQQARDGRSRGDDGAYGAFVDAQVDKVVFCLCLWSFLLFCDWPPASAPGAAVVVATSALLIALEVTIACVRTADYFRAKYAPQSANGARGRPALRAVSEGKLKQKFESVGVALYALCLPDPTARSARAFAVAGTTCLWFAVFFSYQSLLHKLRARAKAQ